MLIESYFTNVSSFSGKLWFITKNKENFIDIKYFLTLACIFYLIISLIFPYILLLFVLLSNLYKDILLSTIYL